MWQLAADLMETTLIYSFKTVTSMEIHRSDLNIFFLMCLVCLPLWREEAFFFLMKMGGSILASIYFSPLNDVCE